jgi:ABC-type transport system substrate-binding protein
MDARVRRVVLVVAVAALIAAGCGGGTDGGSGGRGSHDGEAAYDTSATLRLGANNNPPQFDPASGVTTGVDYTYYPPLYDRLVQLDGDLQPQPMVATDWETSSDGLTWTFHLRDDVTFHDDTPVDAEVVAASMNHARSQRGALAASYGENIADIDAVDPTTLTITLRSPDELLPVRLAFEVELSSIVNPRSLGSPELASSSDGSGPYRLAQVRQDRAVYEKVPGYWDEEVDQRAPARIELIGIADDQARANALRTGAIDGMAVYGEIPDLDRLADGENLIRYDFDRTNRHWVLEMNRDHPELADPRVRQAISLAIDRQLISDTVLWGSCTPSVQPFGAETVGYDSSLDAGDYYDPERARELLADAGADDLHLDFLQLGGTAFQQVTTALQGMLEDVGISTSVDVVEPQVGVATFKEGDYDLTALLPGGAPDPQMSLEAWYLGGASLGPIEPATQRAFDQASQASLGSDERDQGFRAVAQELAVTPLNATICMQTSVFVFSPEVDGVMEQSMPYMQVGYDLARLAVTAS